MLSMGKSTISTVIFNSKLLICNKLPEDTYLLLKTRNRSKILSCVNVTPSHKPTNQRSFEIFTIFFQQLSYCLVNQLSEWVFAPFLIVKSLLICYIMLYHVISLYFDIFCLCNPTTFSGIRGEVPLLIRTLTPKIPSQHSTAWIPTKSVAL